MYSFLGEDPSEAVELCCLNLLKTYSEFLNKIYTIKPPHPQISKRCPTPHIFLVFIHLLILSKSLANSMRDSESEMEEGNLVTKSCACVQ